MYCHGEGWLLVSRLRLVVIASGFEMWQPSCTIVCGRADTDAAQPGMLSGSWQAPQSHALLHPAARLFHRRRHVLRRALHPQQPVGSQAHVLFNHTPPCDAACHEKRGKRTMCCKLVGIGFWTIHLPYWLCPCLHASSTPADCVPSARHLAVMGEHSNAAARPTCTLRSPTLQLLSSLRLTLSVFVLRHIFRHLSCRLPTENLLWFVLLGCSACKQPLPACQLSQVRVTQALLAQISQACIS
jgi:hypothetical protein